MRDPAVFAFALPPVTVAAGAVTLVILGAFGVNPFWPEADLTMAEAAAVRDKASVAVMARAGTDLAARASVRPGMLGNRLELQLTPAEAAVRANRTEILDVLFANGLHLDDDAAHGLVCLGREFEGDEVLPYLQERFPRAAEEPC